MRNRQNRRARAISEEVTHMGPEPEAAEGLGTDPSYDDEFFLPGSYREALEDRGLKVVAETAFGDYQGDLVFVLRGPDGRHGVTVVGYGSCSGCDARQACSTQEEFDGLVDSVVRSIRWGAKEDLRAHLMGENSVSWWAMPSAGLLGEVDELLRAVT